MGHGTHVTNVIADRLNPQLNVCFIIVKWWDKRNNKSSLQSLLEATRYVTTLDNVDFLNLSGGGAHFLYEEKELYETLAKKGVSIFVAAGNENQDLDKDCDYFPACYKVPGATVVGNLKDKKTIDVSSNYGTIVSQWEIGAILAETGHGERVMNGTSQATAAVTAKFVNKRMK